VAETQWDRYCAHLNAIPDDGQHGSGSHDVEASPHAKDTSGDDGIADVVDAGAAGIEQHGNARDELGDEDNNYALPPVQADADHGAPKRPVSKREAEVEGDIVDPSPGALGRRRRVQILVGPS
jgi:hypothetical protein